MNDKNKKEIIERYCKHLEDGYSENSFVDYDHFEIHQFALELDEKNKNSKYIEKIKKAFRKSFYKWEEMAVQMLDNPQKKFFFPIWLFYVKNRFLWGESDKNKKDLNEKVKTIDFRLENGNSE